jgi:DNA-binding MarR family transcriptional regulator
MIGVEQEITPELCAGQVLEIIPSVMHFIRAEMRRQGKPILSVPQLRAMLFLKRHPGDCLSNLAEHLGVTKPTASATVDKLVQRGFVSRWDHPQERRRHVLTLTESGMAILHQAREATRASLAKELANLSEEKLFKLLEGMTLLAEVFQTE